MLRATNRRGRAIVCQTRIFPLVSRGSDVPRGVIVLMEERSLVEAETDALAPT
jgi:hypothetical protein